jgi:ABC-type phosphate transport system substrate-binding protein
MYSAGQPTAEIEQYLQWIMGPDAQMIVEELGFVPIED